MEPAQFILKGQRVMCVYNNKQWLSSWLLNVRMIKVVWQNSCMWLLFMDSCEELKKLQQQEQRALWQTVEWSTPHCNNVCQVEQPICGTICISANELCCTLSLSKGNVRIVNWRPLLFQNLCLLGIVIADRCTHRLVHLLCSIVVTVICDQCTETLKSLIVTIIEYTSLGKYLKCCSSMTNYRAHESANYRHHWKICMDNVSTLILRSWHHTRYWFVLSCEWWAVRTLLMQVIRHCRTPGTCGSKGKRLSVVMWECMLLFEGEEEC